ncbi:ArsR/SmtB family transcription factor [Nonomuraea jiangxiensis]|uniref:Helix-turn-helix domain-containing protein n=1 Tax=Nonomuraea jiangxiensis TaxID=633440 RepID=A0A1G9SHB7_9ACTN|nr:metalloregulator ArsR/SmtB family transcription factor [Nonomuraea jiangxiensis]SDM34888.1 Helix-turn-helix domain-containing protein [Nonomuraea jiangxiensis]
MTRDGKSLSDPKAMRALAHPARLTILNRLGEGSATATEVAEGAGITPSAASYHLRMLAKYGFVEDAPPRRDGRERVWKVTDNGPLSVGVEPDDQPEVRDAKIALMAVIHQEADEARRRALANLDREPDEWRDATQFARYRLRLDADEMSRLNQVIAKLLEPYLARFRGEDEAPSGSRIAEAHVNLFAVVQRPAPGLPTEDHDAR